jgi:hypothetical protein
MSDHFNELFAEIAGKVEGFRQKDDFKLLVEGISDINNEEIYDLISSMLPRTGKNSYTLDRHVMNIIDYIRDRILPVKQTRSYMIDLILNETRYFHMNGTFNINLSHIKQAEKMNKHYTMKYISVLRGEANETVVKGFDLQKEVGKMTCRLELSNINKEFIADLCKINSELTQSKVINSLLCAILFKSTEIR